MSRRFDLADTLLLHIRAERLPAPIRDYRAIPDRKFLIDLAWPERKLSVEVDGGELMQGRHNRAAGMASDCEKQNLLALAGWRCLRFTGGQVKDGTAIRMLASWFASKTSAAFSYPRDSEGWAICCHGRRIACDECVADDERSV